MVFKCCFSIWSMLGPFQSRQRAGWEQIWRMFGTEYKQVDIMLGAGQVKLILSIKREHGRKQGKGGTNWRPHGRSSYLYRWRTLRKCYIHVRRRQQEDVSIIFGSHWKHIGTTFQADREHVRSCYYLLQRSVEACYTWILRVMSIRRKVAQGRSWLLH